MNTAYPPLRPVEPRPPILPSQSLHQDDQRSPTSYRLPSAIPVSSQNGISAHLPISSSNANNAEAGPSNSSVSVNTLSSITTNTKKRVGVANARKRQRAAAFEDVIGSGTGPTGTGGLGAGNGGGPAGVGIEDAGRPPAKQRESPKKKKAQRACAHCQKAHLTCDDNRPCTRCVKRNMAEKCIEGHRKKAKYLLDDAELEALKKGKSAPTESSETPQSIPSSVVDQFPTNDLYFNLPLDQTYSFGSEAANLEYSSLSAILGLNNYSPEQPFLTETPPGSSSTGTVGSVSAVGYVPVPSSGGVGMGGANGMNGSSVNGGGGNTGGGGGPTQFANAAWPSEPQTNISPQALLGGQSIVGYEYGGNASAHHQQQAQQYQRQQQQQQQQQQQDGSNGNGYGGGGGQGGMYDSVSISMQNGRHQQGLTVRSMSSDGSGGNLAFGSQDLTFSQRQQPQSQGQGQSPSQNQSQGGSQQQQQQQAAQQSYLGPSRSMSLPTVPSQQQQQQQQQQQLGQSVVNSPSTSLGNGVGGSGSGNGSVRGSFASLNGTTPPMSSGDSPMSAGAGGSNVSVNGYGGEGTLVGGMVVNSNGVVSAGVGAGLENGNPALGQGDSALDVYTNVTKPYSYIESYQFLMKFLNKSFQKNDILRVIRALAIYRPSMIALQAPMAEDDFVFMEKCLRRTCIELEKLISYTGTPTVVWRRTGEICLVGVEFCLLTEWKKEELVTGRKYIYELFESQSVIEYWENFASHAFENTTQSVFSHCVLLKPGGEPIPCTFCFSIRRDIFDMPSVVIGQWLPLM